jgi:hypothetical protein
MAYKVYKTMAARRALRGVTTVALEEERRRGRDGQHDGIASSHRQTNRCTCTYTAEATSAFWASWAMRCST